MVDVELASNPKIGRFTDAEFRCMLTGVWALAAKASQRGSLTVGGQPATSEDVAHQARCAVSVARRTIDKMVGLGMLDYDADRDCYAVHDWDQINPAPKVDRTAAQRQHRWRGRVRNADRNAVTNGDVTRYVTRDVTPRNAHEVEVEVKKTSSSTTSQKKNARRRAPSRTVDQSSLPDMPSELHGSAHASHRVLRSVWEQRGGDEPTLRGVGLAVAAFPDRDHVMVAREVEHWLIAGRGRQVPCGDVVRRWRSFLKGSPPSTPDRPGDVGVRSDAVRRADAWQDAYGQHGEAA